MSSLDPTIASTRGASSALAYQRLAALAAGLPLPTGGVNIPMTAASSITEAKAEKKPPKEKKEKPAPPPKPSAAAPAPPPKNVAGSVSVGKVPRDEPPRLDEAMIVSCQVAQDVSPTQARLQAEAERLGLTSGKFWRVRSDYYDQELEWRRDVLGASSVTQLCKSMIMENTKLTVEEAQQSGRVKYVCVVLQYAGAKLNKEKLHDTVRKMDGKNAVGKKQYSLRMVSQETSDALSGYTHNAVTPLGMVTEVPVLCSDKIKALPDGQLWIGGGEVDLKLRFDVKEFVEKFSPAGRPIEFADVLE